MAVFFSRIPAIRGSVAFVYFFGLQSSFMFLPKTKLSEKPCFIVIYQDIHFDRQEIPLAIRQERQAICNFMNLRNVRNALLEADSFF